MESHPPKKRMDKVNKNCKYCRFLRCRLKRIWCKFKQLAEKSYYYNRYNWINREDFKKAKTCELFAWVDKDDDDNNKKLQQEW